MLAAEQYSDFDSLYLNHSIIIEWYSHGKRTMPQYKYIAASHNSRANKNVTKPTGVIVQQSFARKIYPVV